MDKQNRIHIIACGVLAVDIRRIGQELGLELTLTFLEGGLHNSPRRLCQTLQEAIDAVSAQRACDRIVVGYGLCGNGTVGISARNIPLVIPRVHDCIALFLGSDQAYRREFAKYPGTYYISAGWYQEQVEPHSQKQCSVFLGDKTVTPRDLEDGYGQENAAAIRDFVNSWQKNYQRAVFINTSAPGAGVYEAHAKHLAQACGWTYESIKGDCGLLRKALLAVQTTEDILVVPPGHVTFYDAAVGAINEGPKNRRSSLTEHPTACTLDENEDGPAQDYSRLGLGIDAGGTYTDAALYEFDSAGIIAKAKALTTKWDYAVGIGKTLAQLPRPRLAQVDLVSVSTTLATNAVVEGHGARVGLLVMPPYGLFEPADIPHEPAAVIAGRLEIDGKVLEPVDAEQVRTAAGRMYEHGVRAFAVSGYAGTINPEHELEVKAIICQAVGCSVTCGHELSAMLDFRTRAMTAILNARIVGRIERFLRQIRQTLAEYGIHAPVMVVKGDGTLMSDATALQKPVETILSGPAASVAGARYLTGLSEAIVVDIGGTTTDTATVKGGAVRVHEFGTRVGRHRTHVKALDMRTIGLGGDSGIEVCQDGIFIGPLRVGPVCWMAAHYPGAEAALQYLEQRIDAHHRSSAPLQFFVLCGQHENHVLSDDEKAIVAALSRRPYSVAELAGLLGAPWHSLLRTEKLEEHHVIMRCGLTPTDLLHISGEFVRWNRDAAQRMCEFVAAANGTDAEALIAKIRRQMVRKLTVEILKTKLDDKIDAQGIDACAVCSRLVDTIITPDGDGFGVRIQLGCPVVGVGAPAGFFLPQAARYLGAEAIIPPHADVANAIGAITSDVLVRQTVRISPDEAGFVIEGLPGARRFNDLQEAHDYAVKELAARVRQSARQAGTRSTAVRMTYQDITAPAADGMEVYLGREIRAELSGRPDIRLPAAESF